MVQLDSCTQAHDTEEGEDVKKINPRRTNSTKRNNLAARVKREEDHCWLCGGKVDTSMPSGFPESPEVDEIIPVSKGGSPYERDNVRLAHRLCNQKRGNGPAPLRSGEITTVATPLKVSRQW